MLQEQHRVQREHQEGGDVRKAIQRRALEQFQQVQVRCSLKPPEPRQVLRGKESLKTFGRGLWRERGKTHIRGTQTYFILTAREAWINTLLYIR